MGLEMQVSMTAKIITVICSIIVFLLVATYDIVLPRLAYSAKHAFKHGVGTRKHPAKAAQETEGHTISTPQCAKKS